MRLLYCLLLMLAGCAAHEVRCDDDLQAVNPPAVSSPTAPTPGAQP